MSGGIAYIYDPEKSFERLCNTAMAEISPVAPSRVAADDPEAPLQRAPSVENAGMGDMLRFDAQRLKTLIERHLLHTGSARARFILDHWDEQCAHFVKVTPHDFRRALADLRVERNAMEAAE
jgi:glutamate synthase (NADPH/NADH) large chain